MFTSFLIFGCARASRCERKTDVSPGVCKEMEMNTFVKVTALAATAAAALFFAQPSQAVTPVVQLHSIIADAAI